LRQGQATVVRAAAGAGRRVVGGAGGAGQRHVRLHRLHQEPVRHGQRADDQLERHGQEPSAETGGPEDRDARAALGRPTLLSRHSPPRRI